MIPTGSKRLLAMVLLITSLTGMRASAQSDCPSPPEQSEDDGAGNDQTEVLRRVEYRLGVRGKNMNKGFRVSQVLPGSAATRLELNLKRYTLEPGDYVVAVDGIALNSKWTLAQAIAESNGVVDLQVWDARSKKYREFNDVKLGYKR